MTTTTIETEPTEPALPEAPRRAWPRVAGIAVVALLIAVMAFLYDPRNLFDDPAATDGPEPRETAAATMAALGEDHTADGTLLYDESLSVSTVSGGVVSAVLAEATTVERGDVLWRIVDEPVVALFGDVPAHRALGVDSVGTDVEQLEANLVALGFDPDASVTVDETFTVNTAAMVERWQAEIRAEATGRVAFGAVVFVPGLTRSGEVTTSIGDTVAPGTPMLTLTALDRVITYTVAASDRATVVEGDPVDVRLPDRTSFSATVTNTVVAPDGRLEVTAAPDGPADHPVDTVPVTVSWSVNATDPVLTVPAAALIRTDAARYHVEVRSDVGTERLVPVDVGRSSGLLVEVTGDLHAGDLVIAP